MKLTFGTDGWRDVIAEGFTVANVRRVAQAHASTILASGGQHVLVAHDTRFLGERFARAAADTLQNVGLNVTLLGTVPTPALSWAVRDLRAAGGIMITASHNPSPYQGYKLKGPYGGGATPALVAQVQAQMDVPVEARQPGRQDAADIRLPYLHALGRLIDPAALRRAALPLYHDAMHGAAGGWLRSFADIHNLQVPVHELRAIPDPLFGGVNPEPIPSNLEVTRRAMQDAARPTFAMVTDGDADRIGAVLAGGQYFNSHQIFAVLLHHLARRGLRGRVVKTVSTSGIIDRLAALHGLEVVQTPVGFKYITEAFLAGESDPAQRVLIGGEESGGIGIQGHVPERDGLLNGLLLQEAVAVTGMGLDDQFAEIERLTGWSHHYDRLDLHLPGELDRLSLLEDAGQQRRLLNHVIEEVVTLDGVKLSFPGGFAMIRPSGTEPVVRLYVEAPSPSDVALLLDKLRVLTLKHTRDNFPKN
ncbi:phosphoglucomutase/phosphomannomutase family protein [Deinococcus budaensis]|uniref:Phosphomannomutase n=1 Tax=Deinococcus budaensis TaxID=1665626 RepID=A0A7W8LQG5_9DEIO|nr:phosphoglucomutase/phosphomannomutase family protein [Deinococcus budaensis]MBB5234816.1 phosphomannomutase [Deinococcus budaensis]